MPAFSSNGGVTSLNSDSKVVFSLKSSKGVELKTYAVSANEADSFEAGIRAEEPKLREEAGETEPLMLVKIQRII